MAMTTIPISEETRDELQELANETGESLQSVLERAVQEYRRQQFIAQLQRDYEALRNDPEALEEYQNELRLWENTLMDGLEDDPYPLTAEDLERSDESR